MSSFKLPQSNSFSSKEANIDQDLKEHFEGSAKDDPTKNPFGLMNLSFGTNHSLGRTLSGALSNNRHSTFLRKMQKLASDSNNDKAIERHIISLDQTVEPNVFFNCIIVAVKSSNSSIPGVGYQLLIVDDKNNQMTPIEETINGQKEVIQRFSEVAWDDVLRGMVARRIHSTIGTNNGEIFFAAPVVITEESNPENDSQVFAILMNALTAANTTLAMKTANGQYLEDFNLASMYNQKRLPELYISHSATDSIVPDEVGNVSRCNFVSRLQTGKPTRSGSYSPNSGNTGRTILETGTFTDLMPVLPVNPNGFQQQFHNPMMPQQQSPLVPIVVITTQRCHTALTPASTVLGVVTAADQIRSNRWVESFRYNSSSVKTNTDFADVGAIVVNMPNPHKPGEYMPDLFASRPNFTDEHLWNLLGTYVRNTPLVAIDVPVASGNSWYMGLYAAAAQKSAKAIEVVNGAVDTLTNGKFKEVVNESGHSVPDIFVGNVYYLERGFWTQGDKYLPIELLDNYVAVCCYARSVRQPALVSEWVDTITNVARPQISRLINRRKILLEMSGGTANFTRSVRRCIFNPRWLDLVNTAINRSGVVIHSDEQLQFSLAANNGYAANLANIGQMNAMLNVSGRNYANQGYGGVGQFGF